MWLCSTVTLQQLPAAQIVIFTDNCGNHSCTRVRHPSTPFHIHFNIVLPTYHWKQRKSYIKKNEFTLVDWSDGRLIGWLINWLIGWLVDWFVRPSFRPFIGFAGWKDGLSVGFLVPSSFFFFPTADVYENTDEHFRMHRQTFRAYTVCGARTFNNKQNILTQMAEKW